LTAKVSGYFYLYYIAAVTNCYSPIAGEKGWVFKYNTDISLKRKRRKRNDPGYY
jgi:hypothetical protein